MGTYLDILLSYFSVRRLNSQDSRDPNEEEMRTKTLNATLNMILSQTKVAIKTGGSK